MENSLIKRQTSISGNIVLLCRFLRSKGFQLTTSEEEDVLNALSYITPKSSSSYEATLKAVLCKNNYQVKHFDDIYQEYTAQLKKAVDSKIKNQKNKRNSPSKEVLFTSLKNWLLGNNTSDEEIVSSYSNIEVLTKKEFAVMDEEEINLIQRVLEKLVHKIARRKSRLKKRSKRKEKVDLRLTIKYNFRQGNEINKIIYSKRKEKKLNIILLCDVSKSMDIYSRFFIHMIYAFQNNYDRIETFTFSTALHKITEILENNDNNKAFEIIAERVPQWSGGTKIGSCLHDFCNIYGNGMLNRKSIVMVLSDGWDTGEPDLLANTMSKINKSCRKLIWLNPLSGNKNFSPEVIGLQKAMPHIDQFAPAHNLESLKEVIHSLR